jgi:hypothetical protein
VCNDVARQPQFQRQAGNSRSRQVGQQRRFQYRLVALRREAQRQLQMQGLPLKRELRHSAESPQLAAGGRFDKILDAGTDGRG